MPSRAWPRLAMPGVAELGKRRNTKAPARRNCRVKPSVAESPPVWSRKIFHAGINDQSGNVIETHEHNGEFYVTHGK
jgi:hypothetical protein